MIKALNQDLMNQERRFQNDSELYLSRKKFPALYRILSINGWLLRGTPVRTANYMLLPHIVDLRDKQLEKYMDESI